MAVLHFLIIIGYLRLYAYRFGLNGSHRSLKRPVLHGAAAVLNTNRTTAANAHLCDLLVIRRTASHDGLLLTLVQKLAGVVLDLLELTLPQLPLVILNLRRLVSIWLIIVLWYVFILRDTP